MNMRNSKFRVKKIKIKNSREKKKKVWKKKKMNIIKKKERVHIMKPLLKEEKKLQVMKHL